MTVDLAVIGQGVVSPAGVGLKALLHGEPKPGCAASLSEPDWSWPVLRVDQKDPALDRWQKEPRLRRSSPISFFMVEAAEQALSGLTAAERAETGIISTFSAGCVVYSRRFFQDVVQRGQKSASPALFPETVFNSPVSHVATVLGLNGAAYALVGDETAWIAALKTASVWLQQARVKQVLVLGAEEFDPIVLDAYSSARWLRRKNGVHGFFTSEGAAAVLVRQNDDPATARFPIIRSAQDGFIYRSAREAAARAEKLFGACDPLLPCYRSAQHNWLGEVERKATSTRPVLSDDARYLGDAFTASVAWNTLRAMATLSPENPHVLFPVWGLNHQLGLLELAIPR